MNTHQNDDDMRIITSADVLAGLHDDMATKDAEIAALTAGRDALKARVSELQADRIAYAREFAPDSAGDPDTGNVHANIRTLKAERDALKVDAVLAALTAFSVLAIDSPESLPEDAQNLAEWVEKELAKLDEKIGVEELFIHIIRAAMTKETK